MIKIGDFNLVEMETWGKCAFCGKTIKRGEKYLQRFMAQDGWGNMIFCKIHTHHFSQEILNEIMIELL